MHSYPALAQAHGIPLPALLRHLIEAGLADYGADVKAWVADWRANKLAAQPALSCIDDFEWIKADEAAETIDEWLNPAYQHGRRFLPFAQTGAGVWRWSGTTRTPARSKRCHSTCLLMKPWYAARGMPRT